MASNPNSGPNPSAKPNMNIFMSLINRLRLTWRLMLDGRVPIYLKIIPFVPIAYLVFPLDLLPDIFPFLGQLDDLGMFILGMEAFVSLAPHHVVQEHQSALNAGTSAPGGTNGYTRSRKNPDDVVDGDWRRVK